MPALLRQLLTGRPEDARNLEQRDPVDAGVPVPLGRLEQAEPEIGPERGHLGRVRLLEREPALRRGHERPRVRLGEAGPDEHVLDLAPQTLLPGQLHRGSGSRGQGRGHLLDPEANDLLDEVDRAGHVDRPPGRHRHLVALDLEAEPLQPLALLLLRERHSAQPVGELGPEANDRTFRQLPMHVGVPGPTGARVSDEQLGRVDGGLLGGVRVDTLLPPRRRIGAEPQPARGAEDRQRVEARRLEQEVGRLRPVPRCPRRP